MFGFENMYSNTMVTSYLWALHGVYVMKDVRFYDARLAAGTIV